MIPARWSCHRASIAAVLMLLLTVCGGKAHIVRSIYVNFAAAAETWQAEVTMDAGYAWPAARNDANAPQPSLEWLQSRTPAEFAELRRESEQLLRTHLSFFSGDQAAVWSCTFPDFDSFPPDFPLLPGDFAFFTIRLNGTDHGGSARLTVRELTGAGPSWTFALGPDDYATLEPGATLELQRGGKAGLPYFFQQGFLHVLPCGWDHILFIIAMFLLDRRLKPVLLQSLCFTAAHTLTLGLVMAGVIPSAPRVVEPLIALSIAALALENRRATRIRPFRLPLIFAFGLVHGMGFGGALAAVLGGSGGIAPLIAANLGVEAAQVAVLCIAALLVWPIPAGKPREFTASLVNLLIAATGLIVFLLRVMSAG